MNKDQIKAAQKELEVEINHIAAYLKALSRGTQPDLNLPPEVKAKVDAVLAKHQKP